MDPLPLTLNRNPGRVRQKSPACVEETLASAANIMQSAAAPPAQPTTNLQTPRARTQQIRRAASGDGRKVGLMIAVRSWLRALGVRTRECIATSLWRREKRVARTNPVSGGW